jgi:hypothetical protein
MKPMLKASGTVRLKLMYDQLLSTFAFNSNLWHSMEGAVPGAGVAGGGPGERAG